MDAIKTKNVDEYRASLIVAVAHLADATKHVAFAHGLPTRGPVDAVTDLRVSCGAIRDALSEVHNAIRLLEEN